MKCPDCDIHGSWLKDPFKQCSPYQAVTGKIYRLKQHFLPPAAAKKYASCDPIRSPRENE